MTIALFVIDVKAIADADQRFDADFYVIASWRDPRLAAEARGGSLAGCRPPLGEVWHPRLDVVNQRFLRKSYPDVVEIDDEGRVEYRQRLFGQLSSPLDLRDFPFDRQRLPIDFVTVSFGPEEVALTLDPRSGRRETFSVAGWSLVWLEPRIEAEYVATVDRLISRVSFGLAA